PPDLRAEKGSAFGNSSDSAKKIVLRGILQQIGSDTGLQGSHDVAFIAMHAQHYDGCSRQCARDSARRLDSVEVRHSDVHDHYVRFLVFNQPNNFASVAGFTDHLEVRLLLQEQSQAVADDSVVVGE